MKEEPSVARVALKYGLIFGVIGSIYGILLYVFHLESNNFLPYLSFVLMVLAIVQGIKDFRNQNEGFISYGQGLSIGALVGTIMGLVSGTLNTFYITVIDSSPLSRMNDVARERLERQGLDDAQIENALEISQKFQSPGILFLLGVIGSVFFAFLLSLIIAAIFQKKRPTFD